MKIALPQSLINTPLAHRGLHDAAKGRIENAMASFRAAIDAGYGIELDVQLSADAQAMSFHDDTLDRLTSEVGFVRERTSRELGTIRLNGTDDTIPMFRDVLDLVAGQVPLLVEIKDQDGAFGDGVGPLERAVARDLQDYRGDCAVMSFNPHSVAAMQALLPRTARGITTEGFEPEPEGISREVLDGLRDIDAYDRVGASFISHDRNDLDRLRVMELKAQGARVLCWTVRSRQEETQARKVAENITFEGYLPALAG
ncbi:glycerophosphodiester phosphodiesterase family protein [Boseongicola aestuarii]|uniref:Glycerophosphoryl diester phosphodiesterase n=1 Tax=Boseongicola aestuarii TaxID=1470561 RepID=A0A238J086_9RHOB|nr:glycerophosphodiester phosphodiesterase family protein [Boseongicola aestuarii]SMX23314.1 Glycerophosphoryl diester phosphodiesterase [Boseongicola aestuarii]